jgi:hypothetical protein
MSDKAMEQAISLAENNQDYADQSLVQTADIDLENRVKVLQEEEFRNAQHHLF